MAEQTPGEDDSELDPRIQIELEKLNTATDAINSLEVELDEASTTFRMLHNESTRRLKALRKRLGVCIERARPYYEALEEAKKTQTECQQAAVQYQRANEIHQAAKETVALAEQRFLTNQHEWQFDNAWQEMLNHATIKVMEAETAKTEKEREHERKAALFNAAGHKLHVLESKLWRNINKSRPYFEEKELCQSQLATQKERVESLRAEVAAVKRGYSASLKALESISLEIHRKRGEISSEDEVPSGVREPGVGAEEVPQVTESSYLAAEPMVVSSKLAKISPTSEFCENDRSALHKLMPNLNHPGDRLRHKPSASCVSDFDYELELDRCDLQSLGSTSAATSSAVSDDDCMDDSETEELKSMAMVNDGREGSPTRRTETFDSMRRLSENWERQMGETISRLGTMLTIRSKPVETPSEAMEKICGSIIKPATPAAKKKIIIAYEGWSLSSSFCLLTTSEWNEKIEMDSSGEQLNSCSMTGWWEMFSFDKCTHLLYKQVDSSSLGVLRALFGLMMVLDVPHERGFHEVRERFGDPMNCHFPLFEFLRPMTVDHMVYVYLAMWIGSVGICLGFLFRLSSFVFSATYWYILLLDKTSWNNHSYLYGLIALQLLFSCAHHSCSIDGLLDRSIRGRSVPVWNYWILRFQFFILYFYAGVKKFNPDWLLGYSMTSLSSHWTFYPFRFLLTNQQIDLFIVHVFGFLLDLTAGFLLLYPRSRFLAMMITACFHLMNSRLFNIGQFPYVCLVTTPIFCEYSWPRKIPILFGHGSRRTESAPVRRVVTLGQKITAKEKFVVLVLICYVLVQVFLPFTHFITLGYNNWTEGPYGYSWDMMVHSWDTKLIAVTVYDQETLREYHIDPHAWVRNTRYSKRADMLYQYASCIRRNMASLGTHNISVHLDVWCSLNKRVAQRFVDPRQDLLKADWNPFKSSPWIFPLLTELAAWRPYATSLTSQVLSWSNNTDALIVADFPGLKLEHFLPHELTNITLTLLRGSVDVLVGSQQWSLVPGGTVSIQQGGFHSVVTTSTEPSCFVYTFLNSSSSTGTGDQGKGFDLLEGWDIRLRNVQQTIAIITETLGNY